MGNINIQYCLDCRDYKYVEANGVCRDCLNEDEEYDYRYTVKSHKDADGNKRDILVRMYRKEGEIRTEHVDVLN